MTALLLVLVCTVAGASAAGPSALRKVAALGFSALGVVAVAVFPPADSALRGIVLFGACVLAMRMVDVVARADEPAPARLLLALSIFDPREMRTAAPALDARLLATGGAYCLLATAALAFVLLGAPRLDPPWAFGGRWIGGLVLIYACVDGADALLRAGLRANGLVARPMQDVPIRSRSLAELWGRRWNRVIGGWLRRWCFRPLARRGHPVLGLLAAFAFSGGVHAVAILGAVGWRAAVLMLAFFLVHGVATLAERPMGVPRWPAAAGHAWVITVFLVTGPLFVEPALQLLGVPPP